MPPELRSFGPPQKAGVRGAAAAAASHGRHWHQFLLGFLYLFQVQLHSTCSDSLDSGHPVNECVTDDSHIHMGHGSHEGDKSCQFGKNERAPHAGLVFNIYLLFFSWKYKCEKISLFKGYEVRGCAAI